MAKKFKTPELEFKFWSEKGLTPSQVMKRMSAKNQAIVAKADRRQAAGDFQNNTFQVDSLKDPTRATGTRDRKRPRAELTDVDVTTRSRLFPGPPDRAGTSDVTRPRIDRLAGTQQDPFEPRNARPGGSFGAREPFPPGGATVTRPRIDRLAGTQQDPFEPRNARPGGSFGAREPFPPGEATVTRPRQAVIERGDTYQKLARKLGVHELDLIRENNGAELIPGTAANVPLSSTFQRMALANETAPTFADFQAEPEVDRVSDRRGTAPRRAGERAQDRFDEPGVLAKTLGVGIEMAKKIIEFYSAEGIASRPGAESENVIWKTKDGQPVDAPVEGLDYVVRTTPIKDMPAGQGSGRLAWAESRLPVGTKLDDYNPQDLLEAGIFKEAEIWWMISQGLLTPLGEADATAGGTGVVIPGAGGTKKVAKQVNFGSSRGARPQNIRQMADLGLTSWSSI